MIGEMESDMSFLYDYEKQGESVWCRGVYLIHSTFEPFWKDIYKWLPLKVQMLIGCLCLLIVTAEYNRSVISQLFQMYLLLQATRQNTCCQLVSFSSRVYYLDNQKKKKSQWCSSFSTAHKAVSITFANCLESDILKAVAPKNGHVAHTAAHILISIL